MTRRSASTAGQQWLWKSARRATPEAALVRAIETWIDVHPDLVHLERHQSGEWEVGRWIKKHPFERSTFTRTGYVRGAREGTTDFTGMVLKGRARLRVGMAIYVECKRDGEKPSDAQIARLTAAVDAGAIGILAYDAEQFERELLEAIGLARDENGRIISA
jgi:hypothetical protein